MAKLKLDEPEIDACRYCGSDRIEDIESGIEQIEDEEGDFFDDPWVVYYCEDCGKFVTIFHALNGWDRNIYHGKNYPG